MTPSDAELAEMSACWGVSVARLRFLAACPHYDSRPHIRAEDYKADPVAHNIAKAIREAIRGSWLPSDAAKIGNVRVKDIEAFICRHSIIWPTGCRRRLEWGRGTTHTHKLNDEHANLLAKGRLTMAEAAALGISEGLTAKETAIKHGFSAPGMYNAAVRQGLRFRSHKEKFGTRKSKPTNLKANPDQSKDPILSEAPAFVELSLRNRSKA